MIDKKIKVNRRWLSDDAMATSPRQRDPERTKARILRVAQEVFSQRGYAYVGVREVAAGAGVDVSMVPRYFGSKEGLFEAAMSATFVGQFWDLPKESFGRQVVALFLEGSEEASMPLRMLLHAAADPASREVALRIIQTQLIGPMAQWLGPPNGEARATEILAVCAGFFTYRYMAPLDSFIGQMDSSARLWLEDTLQAIVQR